MWSAAFAILGAMSWASSRRTVILLIVGVVALLIAAAALIATLYEAPSCADGKQNQDEEGIDCGGSCALLCTASQVPPVVSFVRELPQQSGRLDVIAYVENPNPFAATKDARYEIEFLGENGTTLGTKTGSIDLPPAASVPIFIPNAFADALAVRQTFLSFEVGSLRWYEPEEDIVPFAVDAVRIGGTEDAPRIMATVTNPSTDSFRNVKVVVTLYDEEGTAFTASQTVIASLTARAEADVVFTWNAPFTKVPARIDVRPVRDL